ncbi:mitochondrial import inner membrane translocase subunit Tim29 [Rana temporaria]|uniref:mitochondrial import inner membrane translocase subunit Tim29 n=1 Tax=Rana temporaria TaxID=8407 RepID=UPI001AAE180D|nr:mitochondrial import inner membrane translocase subunit Tim29 [Rana temporaria]
MAGRCVGVLCRRLCSSSAAPVAAEQVKLGFWQRMKNKKFVVWTKHLLRDYGEACKDIVVGAKERPGKATLYISLLAGVGICSSKAPSEDSFQCSLLEASSCLLLLSPWTRNGSSDQHVQRLMELRNEGRLRHINFMLFSLMYEAPYDPDCDLYSSQCSHLKSRWAEFPSRVLDIGFFGNWWRLQNKMKDFDINEEEFTHLPAHMRTISHNDLHSEENERLNQSRIRTVVVMSKDQLKQIEMSEDKFNKIEMSNKLKETEISKEDRLNPTEISKEDRLNQVEMSEEDRLEQIEKSVEDLLDQIEMSEEDQ